MITTDMVTRVPLGNIDKEKMERSQAWRGYLNSNRLFTCPRLTVPLRRYPEYPLLIIRQICKLHTFTLKWI